MRIPDSFSEPKFHATGQCVRSVVTGLLCLAAMTTVVAPASAQEDYTTVEVDNRSLRMAEARAFAEEGDFLMKDGNVAEASNRYRQALEFLPRGPITEDMRIAIVRRYTRSSVAYAKELTSEARYDEARAIVASVLRKDVSPNDREAKALENALGDPDAINMADSPELQEIAANVLKTLKLAEKCELLDDYDGAEKNYNLVLSVDKFNTAAQAGLERISRAKTGYYDTAKTRTRAEMMSEVDSEWETPRVEVLARDGDIEGRSFTAEEAATRNAILTSRRSLGRMVVDRVQFEDTTVSDVLRFLANKTRELDPKGEGVNFVVKDAPQIGDNEATAVGQIEVTLDLRNVPVMEVVKYTARMAGLNYRIEPYAVVLSPSNLDSDLLVVRSYRVRPDFISSASNEATVDNDPFANTGVGDTAVIVKRLTAKEFLERSGIPFDEGATARFDASSSTLTMRNNALAHQRLESMIEISRTDTGRLVEIRVKMVEINQVNLYELGFDWLLGGVDLGSGVVATGGTGGVADFPVTNPATGAPLGDNPVSAGLRSGDNALTGVPMSQLLDRGSPAANSGGRPKAPSIFGVAGVLTQPQFQMVMRGLNQKKGADLLNAPQVVTRSGQVARIEVVREFIYPTEYDPPELPNAVGEGGGAAVTPAFPTAFDMKPIGTILEVDPVISRDGSLVELNIDTELREFLGFINYGAAISSPPIGEGLFAEPVILTDNRILQPIFETRREKTSVSVYDGQSLVIGGLITGYVEDVEDSIPILGDIPLIGRLFKTKAEVNAKKAIILFVEVNVLDPSGRPLREFRQDVAVGSEVGL